MKFCQHEISGFGKIEVVNGDIYVRDLRIFKQTVSSGDTVLNRKALGKFYDEIIQEEGDLSNWKLWFHSHADNEVFFSNIDEQTITDFDSEMPQDNWMLSIVTNHNGKMLVRIDVFSPIRCTISDVDWDISFENKELDMQILDEVAEKVTVNVPRSNNNHNRSIDWKNNKERRLPRLPFDMTGESETSSVIGERRIILPEET